MFNRSAEEFNKSHIDNALNVPYMFITQEGNSEFLAYQYYPDPLCPILHIRADKNPKL